MRQEPQCGSLALSDRGGSTREAQPTTPWWTRRASRQRRGGHRLPEHAARNATPAGSRKSVGRTRGNQVTSMYRPDLASFYSQDAASHRSDHAMHLPHCGHAIRCRHATVGSFLHEPP